MKTKLFPLLVSLMFLLAGFNLATAQTNPCGTTGQPVGCCPCEGCAPITQLPTLCASQLGTITIPVTVTTNNFLDIAAISLKFDYNPSILQFVPGGITAPNLPSGAPLPMAGQPNGPGTVVISWAYGGGPIGSGWTLGSGQVLFNLQFNVISAGVSSLNWNLNDCSYSNVSQVLNFQTTYILCQTATNYVNGRVSLLTASVVQPVETCQMATVQLFGQYTATSGPYTHKWTGPGAIYLNSTTVQNPYFTAPNAGLYSLTYTVTDNYGCSASAQAYVTVKPNPTCSITGPVQVCGGTTNNYTSTVQPEGGQVTHMWTITGDGTISGPNDQATVTVIAGLSGSYTLTDATYRNGCPGWCHVDVTVNANPTAVINGPTPVCGNAQYQYTAVLTPTGGTVTHSWSISGSGTIVGPTTNAMVTVMAGASGYFTIVDNFVRNGCPGTQSKTVTVNPVPSCTVSGPDAVCIGVTTTYTSTVSPLDGTVTHSWTITGNATISGATNLPTVNVVASAAGSFTLTDNVMRNGCPAVCTKQVTVKPTPTVCINGPSPVCGGAIYQYEGDVTPGGGVVTHYWTISGNANLLGQGNEIVQSWTEPIARVLVGASGSFTLVDNITRDGCPGMVSKTIVINPVPSCNISGPSAVCAGATQISFISNPTPTDVTHHWSITGNGTIVGPINGPSIYVTAGAAGSFTVQDDITRLGCTSSCTKIVTVNANPTCAIDGPDVVCFGTTNTHENVVSPVGGVVTHNWTISGNGTLNPPTNTAIASVTAGASGSYTLTDNITRNGCPGVCTKTVNINPEPTCLISGPDSLCQDASGIYTVAVAPGGYTTATYQWTKTGSVQFIGSTTGSTVTVEAGGPGTFTLYVQVTRNGCAATQTCSKAVKVNGTPACNITGPDPVCYSPTAAYTYSSSVLPTGGLVTHNWTITGNGVISGSNTGATVNVTIPANITSTFTLCDNITRNGCTSVCCRTFTVNPIPTCTVSGPLELCQGATGMFINTVLPAGGTVNHSWSVTGNGAISGPKKGDTVYVIAGNGTGTFTVTDDITRNGCSSSCSRVVTVNPLPNCTINGPTAVCGTVAQIYTSTVNPAGGLVTHNWSITGAGVINGAINDDSVEVIPNNVDGTFILTDNTTRNGCAGVCTKTVTVSKQPTCTIAGVDSTCAGNINTFTATTLPAGGTVVHQWNITGNGTITSPTTGATITVQAGAAGAYTVTHELWRNGCYELCQKNVLVRPIPVITCGQLIYATGNGNVATGPWIQANGTCFDYNMCLQYNQQLPYYYLGLTALTSNVPIMNNYMNPFWVKNVSDPATFFAYWASRNITASSPAPYSHLWQIINGQQPWFYVKKYPNGTYKLVDGFAHYLVTHGYPNSNTDTILRVLGDFPNEVLTFKGTFQSLSGCTSDTVTLINRFNQVPVCNITGPDYVCPNSPENTYSAPANLNYQWTISGNGTIVGSSIQQTVVIAAQGTGTYTLTLVLTNPVTLCQSTCSRVVNVQYRNIYGLLKYPNCYNTPMNGITLGLVPVPGTTPIQTTITGPTGLFSFTDLCAGNYTIKVLQNTKPIGGINSTDAAQVLVWPNTGSCIQHARFLSGDVMISGDDYNFIGGADALLIQQHFVYGTPFAGPSWAYWLFGPTVCGNLPAPATTWQITLLPNTDLNNVTMMGIVTGDFDQSYIPGTSKTASDNLELLYENTLNVKENQEFDLPLTATTAMDLSAVSLILNIPAEYVQVQNVLVNGSTANVNYSVNAGVLTIGWYSDQPIHVAENAAVVVLKLKTTEAFVEGRTIRLTLAGDPLNELADEDAMVIPNAVLGVDYVANSAVGIGDLSSENFSISCHPNPFRDYTTISYILPENGQVSLEVVNLVGQVITTCVNGTQDAGKHSVKVSSAVMPSGVYMAVLKYKNDSGEIVKTIRIVVNK